MSDAWQQKGHKRTVDVYIPYIAMISLSRAVCQECNFLVITHKSYWKRRDVLEKAGQHYE